MHSRDFSSRIGFRPRCEIVIRFISITRGNSAFQAHLFHIPAPRRIPSCRTVVQMPCHPFQVDEVFRLIVEQLVALSLRSGLSLALCCKSLTDIPLSVLWERQKRLSTLIKVLPPDAWTYQETDSPAGELVCHPHLPDHSVINFSDLRSVDDPAGYLIAGMGKPRKIRVMDARTRIPRG